MPPVWISETAPGRPIRWGGRTLTPFAHTLGLRAPIPYPQAGALWVWTRPVSLLVQEADGSERVLPIINITRRVTWTLYGVCVLLALVAGIFNWSNRRRLGALRSR